MHVAMKSVMILYKPIILSKQISHCNKHKVKKQKNKTKQKTKKQKQKKNKQKVFKYLCSTEFKRQDGKAVFYFIRVSKQQRSSIDTMNT